MSSLAAVTASHSGKKVHFNTEVFRDLILRAIKENNSADLEEILTLNMCKINYQDDKGMSFLHHALLANATQCIDLLIKYGVPIDLKDLNQRNTLMYAALYCKDKEQLRFFVEKSENINAVDKNNRTALMYAAKGNNSAAIEQLLQCPNLKFNLKDKNDECPLSLAIKYNADLNVLSLLWEKTDPASGRTIINAQDNRGITPLMRAIICDFSLEKIQFLIARSDVNLKDLEGRCAIVFAPTLKDNCRQVINDLLNAKANINQTGAKGESVLSNAILQKYSCSFLKWLIEEKKADANLKLNNKTMPQLGVEVGLDKEALLLLLSHCKEEDPQKILNIAENKRAADRAAKKVSFSSQINLNQKMEVSSLVPPGKLRELIQKSFERAIVYEGTKTLLDFPYGKSISGCASAISLISLLTQETVKIDVALAEANNNYKDLTYFLRTLKTLSSFQKYAYGQHLNWTQEILPYFPKLVLLDMESFHGTLKKKEAAETFKKIFEYLTGQLPSNENKLGAILAIETFTFSVMIKRSDNHEFFVDFVDFYGSRNQAYRLKAFWVHFPSIEKAIEFLSLRCLDLSSDLLEFDVHPVLFSQSKSNFYIPPLPEIEQFTILLEKIIEEGDPTDEEEYEPLKKYPGFFHVFRQRFIPLNFLKDLLSISNHTKIYEIINLLICPILDFFKEKEAFKTAKENGNTLTLKDIQDGLKAFENSDSALKKYSEDFHKNVFNLIPKKYCILFLKRYIYAYLKDSEIENKMIAIKYDLESNYVKIKKSETDFLFERSMLTHERSNHLLEIISLIQEIQFLRQKGFLNKNHLTSLNTVEKGLLETSLAYLSFITIYTKNRPQDPALKKEHENMKKIQNAICENPMFATLNQKITDYFESI